ncbi:hypothetical protein C8Q80DRAFT_1269292 [Daedaleopsis nitida]|nr:hypothetical protein C8Q80DRAFT_1269292 [Daedaleopsis nitida]
MTVLAFRQWLEGEKAINDYCHKTAVEGAKKLVEVMGTRDMDISGELTLNMLPLPVEKHHGEIYTAEQIAEINKYLQEKLLFRWNTYAAHFFHNSAFWCRCSTQVLNEVSDFEYLGKAFNVVCQEIKDTILFPQKAT